MTTDPRRDINPDHPVTQFTRDNTIQLLALAVWRLEGCGHDTSFDAADIERFQREYPDPVVLTHAHRDSVELRLVSTEEAELLAAAERVKGSEK